MHLFKKMRVCAAQTEAAAGSPTPRMDASLCILAGDVCLQVHQDLVPLCRPLSPPAPVRCFVPQLEAPSTWLCKDAQFFTLFKLQGSTLLFSHGNRVLYYASTMAQLAPECPLGTAFLCQFTHDTLPEGRVPRLLVFDVFSPGPPKPPSERGHLLRGMAQHLPQPVCAVQWVGPRRYLSREFVAGLPHAIAGLFYLGADPCAIDVVESLD